MTIGAGQPRKSDADIAVIGGGIVGLSLAYGLLRLGQKVVVYDEGDEAFRASRGNFGLIWVQGKGLKHPAYARWTKASAAGWAAFGDGLETLTGVDLARVQDGGYVMHTDAGALEAEGGQYGALKAALGGNYPYEMMSRAALLKEEPNIGPAVVGALYCPKDGHVNPLRLLRALADAVRQLGGQVRTEARIVDITARSGGFRLITDGGAVSGAGKVVLAAGLGALALGPQLGFATPIRPQQGQVLITEKLPKLMNRPNVEVRQVDEGGVQIGASHAEVGFDLRETLPTAAKLARHACELYPALAKARLVRSWAALRIMSPDGLPIYQRSARHPGAFFVTCHSGITLAAAHADDLTRWIVGQADAPDVTPFREARFDV